MTPADPPVREILEGIFGGHHKGHFFLAGYALLHGRGHGDFLLLGVTAEDITCQHESRRRYPRPYP